MAPGLPGVGPLRHLRHRLGLAEAGGPQRAHPAQIDWSGNSTFAVGLVAVLVGITYGLLPYGGHTMGWTSPVVLAEIFGGIVLLVLFGVIETGSPSPMFRCSSSGSGPSPPATSASFLAR